MPNRLASSNSLYLLQHAENPVDWYEWGPDAFAAARERGVPIFLSIGYATCYWCHVMERESFESAATAGVMNEHFVCVKLDREQRPDVDDVYMTATQTMTGRGGWPMSVFLEPEGLRPFFCGTYYPPASRHGLPSFGQVLEGMAGAWTTKRGEVMAQAQAVADAVREQIGEQRKPVRLGAATVQEAVGTILTSADRVHGGFAGAPKFPQPATIDLMLAVRPAADEPTSAAIDSAVRTTLDAMVLGGIHDQLAGGFHRYSVDETWTVPHFEKMLYDNALLASTLTRASATYDDAEYLDAARRTLAWMIREMTTPDGAFASALDAEVDGREGLNYLWTRDEVEAVLDPDDAAMALLVFGIADGPNFRDPHHADEPPRNVLRLSKRIDELAREQGLAPEDFRTKLDAVRSGLRNIRDQREQPGRDDKVLACWNGLAIRAMAEFALVAGDRSVALGAAEVWSVIEQRMIRDEAGAAVLLRSLRGGQAETPAFLEDYGALIGGLVALECARLRFELPVESPLRHAERLADTALAAFADPESGALHDTRAGEPDLFVRARSTYDGAMPSGTSLMLHALLDLAEVTENATFGSAAVRALIAASGDVARSPVATVHSVHGLFRLLQAGASLDEAFEAVGAADPEPAEASVNEDLVEIYAGQDRVTLSGGEPAEVELRLVIREGYHVLAAQQPEGTEGQGLIPLRVGIAGGIGVAAFADYPAGETLKVAGEAHELLVHHGEVDLTVVLERSGTPEGRPMLVVQYQACTDAECAVPRTVELDLAIDV
ncbi:MAG: thioredoxin domain-containing protein [Planctomycetota bacterium]